jgi:hypothetical protein
MLKERIEEVYKKIEKAALKAHRKKKT